MAAGHAGARCHLGLGFLFIKVGVSELHPLYVAMGRVASGALVLLLILLATGGRLPRGGTWGHNAVIAVIGVVIPFTLFGYGEQRISSILAGIWNSVTPLVVLPLAVIAFRTEKMSGRRLVGLLLGLIGALIILGVWQGVGRRLAERPVVVPGGCLLLWRGDPVHPEVRLPRPESGIAMSAVQLIVASVVLGLLAPLVSGSVPDVRGLSWPVIGSVLTLGAVGTGIAFVIHLRNIRLVGASTASMVTYIVPVFATVVGAVVLGEGITWYQPVGAALVLLGVAVAEGCSSAEPTG